MNNIKKQLGVLATKYTFNTKDKNKSKKLVIIIGILMMIPLLIFVLLVVKANIHALKFTSQVKKVQSSSYYKDYIKNIHTYLESNNGEYINYRSCNVTRTDALWDFKQPQDAQYYYSDFSTIYNTLEGRLRGEHSDVKKNMPAEYKKDYFSGFTFGVDNSIQKRQNILNLNISMEGLFNSNEYIDYCSRVIYQNTIDKLSKIKVNANGSNTVVSAPDNDFDKKQSEELVIMLENQKAPNGFEQAHQGFIDTLKAISATYGEVYAGTNDSDSVKKYREEFQLHKASLDKNLKDLALAAKQKITSQPDAINERLKAVEQ